MKPNTGSTGNLLPFSKQSDIDYDEFYFPYSKEERKEHSSSILAFIFYYLLIILVLSLFQIGNSYAQSTITPLKPGDTIPQELRNLPMQVVNQPEGTKSITLNGYKDKLIIIDFWATHCIPCIKSLYTMDTLQKKFHKDLVVLPTTTEPKEKIIPFIQKRGWQLPYIVSQTVLNAYFPHNTIPHQVWIHHNKILAITSENEASNGNIQAILDGKRLNFYHKRDINFDPFTPIAHYANDRNAPILYRSSFTAFIDGTGGSMRRKNDTLRSVNFLNMPVLSMYSTALRTYNNRIIAQTKRIEELLNLKNDPAYLYCYQLLVPLGTEEPFIKEKIISDLNSYFHLNGHFEKRLTDCYVFQYKTVVNELQERTAPGAAPDAERPLLFNQLVGLLNSSPVWSPDQPVFIDDTNCMEPVSQYLPLKQFKTDPEKLEQFLMPYRLKLVKERREIEMFIIADKATSSIH